MKLSFSQLLYFFVGLILFFSCNTEETKSSEATVLSTSSPTNQGNISQEKSIEEDSISFVAYTDSVETILEDLKVSEAQAEELSETMSKMIKEVQKLQKGNQTLEMIQYSDNDLPKNLNTYLYMKIDSFPKNLLPQNTKNLYIGGASEDEEQYLFGLSDEGSLKKLIKLPTGFHFNPNKKTKSYYSDEKIFICSEESYKATVICGIFTLDLTKNQLILEDQTATDLSVEAIAKAQQAIEAGKIIEAIGFYEQVAYPHTYMQVETETIQLLKKTYSVLQTLEKEQNYDSAILVLESVFDFWGTDFLLNIETPEQLQELFKNNNFELSEKEYIYILEKYGTLLLQSEKYVDAVEINKKLTQITPTSALAYLQLGNAYYKLERLEDSQNAYRKYKEIISKTEQKVDKGTLTTIEKRLKEK